MERISRFKSVIRIARGVRGALAAGFERLAGPLREAAPFMVGHSQAGPRRVAEITAELIGAREGSRVLLVGEEEGLLASLLVERYGASVVWLDAGADLSRLPQGPASFDAVAAQFTLEWEPETARALASWAGALREGGRLVAAVSPPGRNAASPWPSPRPLRSLRPAELMRAAKGAGLRRVRVASRRLPAAGPREPGGEGAGRRPGRLLFPLPACLTAGPARGQGRGHPLFLVAEKGGGS